MKLETYRMCHSDSFGHWISRDSVKVMALGGLMLDLNNFKTISFFSVNLFFFLLLTRIFALQQKTSIHVDFYGKFLN